MGRLKLSPELALGYAELKFLVDSMNARFDNVAKQQIVSYGIVKKTSTFEELKVSQGSGANLSIAAGSAVDSNLNTIIIENALIDHLSVPQDGVTRYVVISYQESVIEEGTISVQADGTVTGVGTKFTERLRGLSSFPSKIKLPNSTNNTGEYFVQSVASDTVMTLNVGVGTIGADTDQKYSVVGSFTPGTVIPAVDQYPFISDSYQIELRDSATVTSGLEFLLAEVNYQSGTLTVVDKRLTNLFAHNALI